MHAGQASGQQTSSRRWAWMGRGISSAVLCVRPMHAHRLLLVCCSTGLHLHPWPVMLDSMMLAHASSVGSTAQTKCDAARRRRQEKNGAQVRRRKMKPNIRGVDASAMEVSRRETVDAGNGVARGAPRSTHHGALRLQKADTDIGTSC